MKRLINFILASVICSSALGQRAMGFRGNFDNPGNFLSPDIRTPDVLWKYRTDGQIFSSPVVYDGVLFIGSNDKCMYALNALTSELLWKFEANGRIKSSPAVDETTVYFGAFDSTLYAVDRRTGLEKWHFRTRSEGFHRAINLFGLNTGNIRQIDPWDFYFSSPVIDGNRLYVGSGDSSIYCFDKNLGTKLWEYKTRGVVHSSPAIGNGMVYCGSWDSKMYAFDALSGKIKWEYQAGIDTAYNCFVGFQASPVLYDGVLYCGSRDAAMYALDANSGKLIWRTYDPGMSWFPSSVAVRGDYLYTGSSDARKFYCFNRKNGYIEYYKNTWSYTFSSPALTDNAAYIGSANGRIYCFELSSGNLNWAIQSDASRTSLFVDAYGKENKRFYSDMYDYGTGWENTKHVERLCSSNGAVFSSPFVANGIIYYGATDGFIYAIQNSSGGTPVPACKFLTADTKSTPAGCELTYATKRNIEVTIRIVSYKDGKYSRIKDLFTGHRESGVYSQPWDKTDKDGKPVNDGVYFFELILDDFGRFIQVK
ncbi:MAG TPA: PQQ-binding-like beta-propeller repeat protein [Lentimicrobium sp.]|nr:PQQ-binding-like beta-propeller repeat protein [Lentimicrobium sp.]